MCAGNRDLQSSLGRHLSTYFFEVDTVMPGLSQYRIDVDLHRFGWRRRSQLLDKAHSTAQIRNGINIHAGNNCRLFRILLRQDQMLDRALTRQHRDRQCTLNRSHTTIERQFADAEIVNQIVRFGELTIRAKNSEGDWQIKTRALFSDVSGSEIDCRLLKRKEVTAVLNGSPDAFARFAYGGVRKTNDRDRWRLIVFATNRS